MAGGCWCTLTTCVADLLTEERDDLLTENIMYMGDRWS